MENKNVNPENKKRMSDGTATLLETTVCCLFYVLACSYIPIALYLPMGEWLSAALAFCVSILGIFVLARVAHAFHAVATYAVILGIFVVFGGVLLPIGLFSAFATAACLYAFLLLKRRNPFVWGLPLIPLIIALLLFGSNSAILLSLSTLPCALLLAYSVKNKLGRVSAVCHISFGICLFTIALFVCAVWETAGEISVTAAKSLIDAVKVQLTDTLSSLTEEMGSLLGYDLASSDTASVISAAVATLFNLLPALIITLANVSAYIIHSLYLSIAYVSDEERKEALPMLTFDMSLHSAIIYVVALALSFILVSDSVAIYGTVAENVMLVLAPGLILTALAGIRALSAKKGPSCLGTLVYFGVIFMLFSLSAFAIIGVSLAGAILIILAYFTKRKSDKVG